MDTPSLTSETKSAGLRRGAWTEEEDSRLRHCMETYGMMKWCYVPAMAGLNRCRKSCRLRWLNYLSPNLKRGRFEEDEDDLIIRLHKLLGNRWSLIAGRLPGRTANDIKNHWNSHLSKKNISKEKREGNNNNFKVVRPQPQTMSPGWSWPRHQLVFAGRKQEKPQTSSSSPSSSNNKATEANINLISKDVDNDLLDWENLMTEVFPDDDSREEDARGIKDDEFFLPGNRDWADFIVDLDF